MKVDLSEAAIDRAVRAHAYGFSVLQWLDARGRRDAPSLAALEHVIQDAEQAARWAEASWAELPADGRPEVDLASAVGAMLASFFEVSFRIEVSRGLDGALLAAKILHRPSPMKRPRVGRTALEALQRLAIANGRRPSSEELRAWLGRVDPAGLEVWLYAVELVHRAGGAHRRHSGDDALATHGARAARGPPRRDHGRARAPAPLDHLIEGHAPPYRRLRRVMPSKPRSRAGWRPERLAGHPRSSVGPWAARTDRGLEGA